MKTEYITFVELPPKPKAKMFDVMNMKSDDWLGVVRWYAPWRKYCFFPADDIVFCADCLRDIQDFINKLMDERRKKGGKNDISRR